MSYEIVQGDAARVVQRFPDNSFDSVVTDPPYGLRDIPADLLVKTLSEWLSGNRGFVPKGRGFMGKSWDEFVPPPAAWDEAFRVLKPGGYLLAFAGTKTVDLMGLSIRLAGFEIRDSLDWLYGSGFPKSRDIGKAIDSEAGAVRAKKRVPSAASAYSSNAGNTRPWMKQAAINGYREVDGDTPATDAAKQWSGWGTALKPAHEPVILARKPLATGRTVAANVLEFGTGGVNIDGCRISASDEKPVRPSVKRDDNQVYGKGLGAGIQDEPEGRWPPNIILTHSPGCRTVLSCFADDEDAAVQECAADCPVAEMDRQSGVSKSQRQTGKRAGKHATDAYGDFAGQENVMMGHDDSGGASRFFPCFKYSAKAPKSERPVVTFPDGTTYSHATVKPVAVMCWLVKLVTPPGGRVLDLFAGSGTTGEACELEGFDSVLIENDPKSALLIHKRMSKYEQGAA